MSTESEGSSRAQIVRRSANFHPTVWGDYFLNYTCDHVAIHGCADEIKKLKEEVRGILKEVGNEPSEQLNLIDALQRLGISYHFETEIEKAMKQVWWKDLDLASKLPFTRDRLVESYFWSIGAYFEPSYSLARAFLTKATILTSIVDDIFDVYGTIEELKLFAGAFERWDASCIDLLPGYMKICYQVILGEFEKMEEVMEKEGCCYHVHYAKEAMKDLVRAYLVEAKWYSEGQMPRLDEYISNGLVSSAYYSLIIASLVGMGNIISKEGFEWVMDVPKPLRSSSLIARLFNDVTSHQFEQRRGHVASAVECYMEEYGASEQEACREFSKMIEEAWKDVNEGCYAPSTTSVPRPLLMRIVNFTRMLFLIYNYDEDSYTHSETRLKENVELLFINPVDP
ncbi:hypothetical protein Scep_013183 [Stephania cephalantha]|uniref:Sesquiterpene synthase n=1 Tax=Stephania cephalantha TaxID=152367 RepID=A0AAP0JHD0_9MAGN